MEEERKRHRLSTVDLLPEEAESDIAWALAEFAAGKRLQKDIWQEFNSRLADRGIGPIPHSTFGRYALRKRKALQRLKEVREIAGAFVTAQDAGADDDITSAVAGTIKQLIFEMTENGTIADPKSAMEAARAIQSLVSAQRMSTDRRQKLKAELVKAVDTVEGRLDERGEKTPDKAALLREIREDVYSVFERVEPKETP